MFWAQNESFSLSFLIRGPWIMVAFNFIFSISPFISPLYLSRSVSQFWWVNEHQYFQSAVFSVCVPFVIALEIPLRWVTFIGMLHFSQSVCSYSWCGEQMQIVYAILCKMCVCFCLDCVVWEWVLFKMKISVLVCLRIINDFN